MPESDDVHDRAADSALSIVGWDGFDPRPVTGVMLALAGRLESAGHTSADIAKMFENLANVPDAEVE